MEGMVHPACAGTPGGRGPRGCEAPGVRCSLLRQQLPGAAVILCLPLGIGEEEESPWQPRTDVTTTTCHGAPKPARFGAERGAHVPARLQTLCGGGDGTGLPPAVQGGVTYHCPNFTAGNKGKVMPGNRGWPPTSKPQPSLSGSAGVLGVPSPPRV